MLKTLLKDCRQGGTALTLQSDFGLEEARKQLGRKIDAIERRAA